ncbi:MAG: acyltransferase [Agathobacter sp.]
MRIIKNVISVLGSDLFLMLRKILGCGVKYNIVSIVSPLASLKTRNGGRIVLGARTCIRPNTEISSSEGSIQIGSRCFINRNSMVVAHEQITIGNDVTVGPGTYIYDHDHDGKGGFVSKPIIIEDNVWIGARCTILKGVKIGKNSIIAANTLVLKDVPEGSVVKNPVVYQISKI